MYSRARRTESRNLSGSSSSTRNAAPLGPAGSSDAATRCSNSSSKASKPGSATSHACPVARSRIHAAGARQGGSRLGEAQLGPPILERGEKALRTRVRTGQPAVRAEPQGFADGDGEDIEPTVDAAAAACRRHAGTALEKSRVLCRKLPDDSQRLKIGGK